MVAKSAERLVENVGREASVVPDEAVVADAEDDEEAAGASDIEADAAVAVEVGRTNPTGYVVLAGTRLPPAPVVDTGIKEPALESEIP